MKTPNYLKPYIIEARYFKIQLLKNKVSYYENGHFPELKECTGFSQYDRLDMAKQDLENFKTDCLPELNKSEWANFLRIQAIEQYQLSIDFPENPYIKIPSIKKAIKYINTLKTLYPELECYSNKFLCSRTRIKINHS